MKLSVRFLTSSLSVLALTMAGVAQTNDSAASLAGSTAGYADVSPIDINQASQVTIGSDSVFDATTGLLENNAAGGQGPGPGSSARAVRTDTSTIDGMDSLVTFDGAFITQAGPSLGKLFRFTMIGNHPLVGGKTNIPAPIATVSLNLLNPDGTLFATVPFAPFESLTLQSPDFNFINYRSGNQIQYADAVHRAQFFNRMAPNWHTTLVPNIVDRVTFTVPKFVSVRLANGNIVQALAYQSGIASDGSRFVLMLNLLFNSLFSNGFINEINNGNFTTDALSTLMLPNTYLYSLNTTNPLIRGSCCVLGFHTYFRDSSAVPQPRFVAEYASWISPGLFGGGFQDVTALSHEISEAFADPFVDNATASWQFAGVPANSKMCQANLEEGDPIETLPVASIPVAIKEKGQTFVYHPQVIPLLQWFEMGPTSNAIDGAFSFPDETTLPHSAIPCPQ
ncbi:MAG TPA: hypothetical protein VNX88_01970 [Terriglobales bacterium]|jgi:hypothetical protein|nr:hypothetical protein [Terriglobales bacterium]